MLETYRVSTDKSLLNVDKIHHYLSNESYWAKGRSLSQVITSIDNSRCFDVYDNKEQLAFARVVTDTVSFAYLLDVFVFEAYQNTGVGKLLLKAIFNHHELQNLNWLLRTYDTQGLYEKYGFKTIDNLSSYMKKLSQGNN